VIENEKVKKELNESRRQYDIQSREIMQLETKTAEMESEFVQMKRKIREFQ
jgi:uncharacterized membrane-anchored protein YhcB (DUF1043 family)